MRKQNFFLTILGTLPMNRIKEETEILLEESTKYLFKEIKTCKRKV